MPTDCDNLVFPKSKAFLLLGGAAAISAGLTAALMMEGYTAIQITPGRKTAWKNEQELEVDFSSKTVIQKLQTLVGERFTPGALINLLNFSNEDELPTADQSSGYNVEMLFLTLKAFAKELKDSIKQDAGWMINFTQMDGEFGLSKKNKDFNPFQAGSIGVMKTVSREWPGSRVKCIDINDELDPHMLLPLVLEELTTTDSALEVGFTSSGRWVLTQERVNSFTPKHTFQLDPDAVIVITGGAYGITAEFAKHFATHYQATLILLGRSLLPEKESNQTSCFSNQSALRSHLIKESNTNDNKISPADIEKKITQIFKDREILDNLQNMKDAGSKVEYFSVDVSDTPVFQKTLDYIYDQYGRIDGVIHGAGIIDDKLISKKTLGSFRRVFTTKTGATKVLLETLRPETLKFVLLFSSVAARYGNVGQSDYSAANEVLNKTAQQLRQLHPESKIVSINWGPWDSGMVTNSLSKLYAKKGIGLIPLPIGIQMGIDELSNSTDNVESNTEVLIAADVNKISQWGLGT